MNNQFFTFNDMVEAGIGIQRVNVDKISSESVVGLINKNES